MTMEDLEYGDVDVKRNVKGGGGLDEGYYYGREDRIARPIRRRGVLGLPGRFMDLLVEHGVEERGIQPRPEDERDELKWTTYLMQFTFWAALNTNILTFSEGVLGPALFGLDLRTSVLCIIFFTAMSAGPVAYLATNGPKTGMRQMVQARFALGYIPALVFGLINCVSFVGFLSLLVILGGQCLSLASGGSMSWTVGIVVVAILSLMISFVGLRAINMYSLSSFPVIIILYVVIVGINGSHFHLATSEIAKAATSVNASGVLGYGASLIGFTVSYTSLASDFTSSLPAHTPRYILFPVIYIGLFLPIVLIQILGAAAQLAAFAKPDWAEAAAIGIPNLLFTMTGGGGAAKFVMVLFCFSVTANTAPTIYSCGLSGQVAIPYLVRVPRYFLAILVSAIYIPISIAASTHFFTALENFLSILAYWTAMYVGPVLIEPMIFRRPVSRKTYPVEDYDKFGRLPIGLAAVAGLACGIPIVAAGMSQTWWTGWIARAIPGGAGDVAWEMAVTVVALVFLVARYLERRFFGR